MQSRSKTNLRLMCLLWIGLAMMTSLYAQEKVAPKPEAKPKPTPQEPVKKADSKENANAADNKQPNAKPKDPAPKKKTKRPTSPLGKFVTVKSPVDDSVHRAVYNTALKLQEQAAIEDRRAFLVLEIQPGNSEFHQVYGLAKKLTRAEVARVTTIAWIPETVTGNNVIVALGCNEIVMHPDASLGDIGRGKAVAADERQTLQDLVKSRHNSKLNRAIVEGMVNPQSVIRVATIERDGGNNERRVVSPADLTQLRENRVTITDVENVKEAGEPGKILGSQARSLGILVNQTATSREELANIYGLDREALREDPTAGKDVIVQSIKINEPITPGLEAFVQRQIDRCVAAGANVIVFEVESPGGGLWPSIGIAEAIAELAENKIRTVAYIPDFAISGAALISFGCDEIYIGEEGQIGDIGVIAYDADAGSFKEVPEKLWGPLSETLRSLAEKKHRPAALMEAMTLKETEVYRVKHRDDGRTWYMTETELHASNGEWIKDLVVAESEDGNRFLTVTGKRAVELKLAEAVVENQEELIARLNLPPETILEPVGRTWMDALVFTLSSSYMTGFLLFLAIILIYVELHFMVGIFGILSALCFALFFWSKFLGGTAGWLEVTIFVLGLACIGMEVFVIPGFGVFGVSGGLLVFASLIMASQTFGQIQPGKDYDDFTSTLTTISSSVLAVIIMASVMSRFLPSIPFLNMVILQPPSHDDGSSGSGPKLRPELSHSLSRTAAIEADSGLIGEEGEAMTVLRPSGKARIRGEIIDVVSQGPYIDKGAPIRVVHVSGNRVEIAEIV